MITCAVVAVIQAACAAIAADAPRPNVIVFLADDLGYGDVGCYGAKPEHVRTPNIDRLAKQGLRFTDAHAPSSVCTPTRYALLTGEYAFRNPRGAGILPGDAPLAIPPGAFTLPAMFKEGGYATGFVGKWHLGLAEGGQTIEWNGVIKPGPLEIGFDNAFYMPSTGDRVPTVFIRDHRVVGLDTNDPIRISYKGPLPGGLKYKDNPELANVLKPLPGHGHNSAITRGISRIGYMSGGKSALWKDEEIADTLAHEAVAFIERHKDQPFFLYFATHGIHEPRVPHPRFRGRSGAGTYGDHIEELDDTVGRVLGALDRLKLADNTLVIFSSDNGGCTWKGYDYGAHADFNGHRVNGMLRGEKGSVWEGGTRVPAIVRWPGHVAAGRESAALLSLMDLEASLARLINVKLPDDAAPDSAEVLDAWLGKSTVGRRELIEHRMGKGCALRVENWKLIDGKLFDLSKDLSETRNLAEEQTGRVQAMTARLKELQAVGKTRN